MTNDFFDFTVGIVTFNRRFDKFFKPLVTSIRNQYPNLEIQVCVNGTYNQPFDEEYRKNLLEFCASQQKVYPMIWTDFRSLSKMWNNVIINSTKENVLVLNDDLVINPLQFMNGVQVAQSNNPGKTFKINNSWSHFLANRKEIAELGWFDERLLGVGNEDGDMQLRFEQNGKKPFLNCNVSGVHNCIDDDDVLEGIEKVCKKYTKYNDLFFKEKWNVSSLTEEEQKEYWVNRDKIEKLDNQPNGYPYERFWWENKHKLKG